MWNRVFYSLQIYTVCLSFQMWKWHSKVPAMHYFKCTTSTVAINKWFSNFAFYPFSKRMGGGWAWGQGGDRVSLQNAHSTFQIGLQYEPQHVQIYRFFFLIYYLNMVLRVFPNFYRTYVTWMYMLRNVKYTLQERTCIQQITKQLESLTSRTA